MAGVRILELRVEPMSPAELDALEVLANAATPGPWSTHGLRALLRFGRKQDGPWDEANEDDPREDGAWLPHDEAAAFIAAARTAVPALIARVRELEQERDIACRSVEERRVENGALRTKMDTYGAPLSPAVVRAVRRMQKLLRTPANMTSSLDWAFANSELYEALLAEDPAPAKKRTK